MKVWKQAFSVDPGDHVFVMVECEGRPTVSLDFASEHGRRYVSVRADGMTIASVLTDVDELSPHGGPLKRFCPYCGSELEVLSSRTHVCPAER